MVSPCGEQDTGAHAHLSLPAGLLPAAINRALTQSLWPPCCCAWEGAEPGPLDPVAEVPCSPCPCSSQIPQRERGIAHTPRALRVTETLLGGAPASARVSLSKQPLLGRGGGGGEQLVPGRQRRSGQRGPSGKPLPTLLPFRQPDCLPKKAHFNIDRLWPSKGLLQICPKETCLFPSLAWCPSGSQTFCQPGLRDFRSSSPRETGLKICGVWVQSQPSWRAERPGWIPASPLNGQPWVL